ncbi:hypothetical protein NPM06_32650, partial [Bacillus cereus]|nr:hypothetical protein [Bacillus cereus]
TFKKSSCAPLEFFLHFSGIAACTKQRLNKEVIEYIEEPIYHGNPIDENGSLVTFDCGQDMIEYIYTHTNMYTIVYLQKDRSLGLDAEFLHVFISKKQENKV